MVNGIDKRLVIHKDDYAYIPAHGWIEDNEYFRSCYTEKGWKDTGEPAHEKAGEEGSLFNHQGHYAGALATWYNLTGNEQALRLAGEMVRFVTKPKFWADFGGRFSGVMGAQHARWSGHFHGYINTLRAILDYAVVTDDSRLKQFVRDGTCAFMVRPDDFDAYADKIIELLDNHELRDRMGKKGRNLIESEFNWSTESDKLLGLYKSFS